MPKSHPPDTPELHRQLVATVRAGRSLEDLAATTSRHRKSAILASSGHTHGCKPSTGYTSEEGITSCHGLVDSGEQRGEQLPAVVLTAGGGVVVPSVFQDDSYFLGDLNLFITIVLAP